MSRHQVGDKGQRYEVRATGWPVEGQELPVALTDDLAKAERMARSIRSAPSCTSTVIFDRKEQKELIRQYGGILR